MPTHVSSIFIQRERGTINVDTPVQPVAMKHFAGFHLGGGGGERGQLPLLG